MKAKRAILPVAWCIACGVIILVTAGAKRSSMTFYGIAETKEIVINSQKPVAISKLHVVPGQAVSAGDLLVELVSPELSIKINDIAHQLDERRAQKSTSGTDYRVQISQLEAQKKAKINEIESQIEQLSAQHKLNKELLADLKSVGADAAAREKGAIPGPLERRIESLRNELALAVAPIDEKIRSLKIGRAHV